MKAPSLARALLWTALGNAVHAQADSLATCAAMADNERRLACYDALATAAGEPAEAPSRGIAAPGKLVDAPLVEEAVAPVNLAEEELLLGMRLAEETTLSGNAWVITPHQRNYLLPVTYNNNLNRDAWSALEPDDAMDRVEAKFQISLKTIAWENILGPGSNLWVAYTQRNWWQLYNDSSPFRETNYQPEVFLTFANDWRFWGFTNTVVGAGFKHESNGKGGDLSRSWNRVMGMAAFERRRMALNVRVWSRIPESRSDDDNPDIMRYMGYGDIAGIWKWREHEFGVRLRNNLRNDNRGAVELEWTFPINRRFKGYIQYFNGYGESLIDYDRSHSRIGFGLSMTDIL
ncbi:MAG: phospholipase A [Haliea sp.]